MRRDEPRLPPWVRFDPDPVPNAERLDIRRRPAAYTADADRIDARLADPIDARLAELRAIVAHLPRRRRERVALWRWLALATAAGIAALGLGLPLAWGLDELRAAAWPPAHSE